MSVCTTRSKLVAVLRRATVAPATGAPLSSETVPSMTPVVAWDCASAAAGRTSASTSARASRDFISDSLPPRNAWARMSPNYTLEEPRDLHPPRQTADLFLDRLVHLAGGFVDGRGDEVLQHLDVLLAHHLGVDAQGLQVLLAVHHDLDHAPAGGGLDLEGGDLLLHALLRLLQLLHELLRIAERVHGRSSLEGARVTPCRGRRRPCR